VGWYIYGLITGVPFFDKRVNVGDGSEAKSTPKDRFVVTVGAILYLMFPTLVGGTFKMFDCRTVGKGTWLHVDMEESCSGDRYQLMRLLLGFSQLLLYVCGLPLLMLWFLVRNRGRLETLVVQSRYGLFFAGYVVLLLLLLYCYVSSWGINPFFFFSLLFSVTKTNGFIGKSSCRRAK
jgi:hypothetical protein